MSNENNAISNPEYIEELAAAARLALYEGLPWGGIEGLLAIARGNALSMDAHKYVQQVDRVLAAIQEARRG